MNAASGPMSRQRTGAVRRGWRVRLAALAAVVGPGLPAGLSDDDPAGITTYSVLGTNYGYRLRWVLLLSTIALIIFHGLAVRIGIVTGQGLIGLVRDRHGPRVGGLALLVLLVANLGTTCAELAGVAAGFELFGVDRHLSVPLAAMGVSFLVLKGAFHRVEHILMGLAAAFICYVVAGFAAGPDWGLAARGLVTPTMPLTRDAAVIVSATVGTTLAPWGLSFIQSYAVDKKLSLKDLRLERVDVVLGSVLTGVIGFFVVVTCAATLHVSGASIGSAADAASALEPLVGGQARTLFAVGLIGSAVLAAAIRPLSTAYSVCEFVGREGALDDGFRRAPLFYGVYLGVMGLAGALVLLPGVSLIPVLVLTQVLNVVLVLPLMIMMYRLGCDPEVMDDHDIRRGQWPIYVGAIMLVGLCVAALAGLTLPIW